MLNLAALAERMSRLKYFKGLSVGESDPIIRSGISAGLGRRGDRGRRYALRGMFVLLSGMVYLYRTSPTERPC